MNLKFKFHSFAALDSSAEFLVLIFKIGNLEIEEKTLFHKSGEPLKNLKHRTKFTTKI